MIRARLASIFITSQKKPRLPRNLHRVATWRSPANAIRKKHATWHVESVAPATKNDDGHVQSAAPATKTATHLLKTSQKYCACHTKRHVAKHVWMSSKNCHACHAKRSNETFETSKNDHSCRTYHRATRPYGDRTDGCGRLRAVANGCGRLRTVANKTQRRANTPSAPRPPCETGTLATHSGKVPHSPERKSLARGILKRKTRHCTSQGSQNLQ